MTKLYHILKQLKICRYFVIHSSYQNSHNYFTTFFRFFRRREREKSMKLLVREYIEIQLFWLFMRILCLKVITENFYFFFLPQKNPLSIRI